MLDIERVIQTGIPDITPVYGGVRGRTLSSHKQAYAWKTVVDAGLKQVIDLRKDYSADRYPELCRLYGVDYLTMCFTNAWSSPIERICARATTL